MDTTTKKSNKIREIVRLQQILKKWKKIAANNNNNKDTKPALGTCTPPAPAATSTNSGGGGGMHRSKSINKFLKKTLSFSDLTSSGSNTSSIDIINGISMDDCSHNYNVPKGYLAVCVVGGKDVDDSVPMKKFIIPTHYLKHQAFALLLRQAEEEFGFQQEGILKIPCEIPAFQNLLKIMTQQPPAGAASSAATADASSSSPLFFSYDDNNNNNNIIEDQGGNGNGCVCSPPQQQNSSSITV